MKSLKSSGFVGLLVNPAYQVCQVGSTDVFVPLFLYIVNKYIYFHEINVRRTGNKRIV